MIKVIAKEVGKPAEIREIENTYKAIREFIGDDIEFSRHPKFEGMCIISDEEYLLKDLPATMLIPENNNVIAGNCLIVADDDGETVSLTDEQAQQALADMQGREFCNPTLTVAEAYYAMQEIKRIKKEMQM